MMKTEGLDYRCLSEKKNTNLSRCISGVFEILTSYRSYIRVYTICTYMLYKRAPFTSQELNYLSPFTRIIGVGYFSLAIINCEFGDETCCKLTFQFHASIFFKLENSSLVSGSNLNSHYSATQLTAYIFNFSLIVITRKVCYENMTYQKLFQLEYPAAFKGKLTAKPSGKFCMPIPIARFLKTKKKSYTLWEQNNYSLRLRYIINPNQPTRAKKLRES